jgi:hypothetical protein
MMTRAIRELMIAKACNIITKADAAEQYPVGTRFDFDILGDPRAKGAKVVAERILEKVCGIDLSRLIQFGPFEVVYVASHAPADLVCKDADGDHFYIPSGVLALLDKCKEGDFPPAFPGEDEGGEDESPEAIIKTLLDNLKKAA